MSSEKAKASYQQFFAAAHEPGVLDAKTKELLHIAVVLALRCEP